jgi:tetratricopeptide (TPR) repeat protein
MPKLLAAATKAVELDPTLAEAYASIAVYKGYYQFDFEGFRAALRKAIELNPEYATAHHWLGEHLMFMGRFDEGLAEYDKALAADPLSLAILSDYGAAFYFKRDYARSIEVLKKAIAMDPSFMRSYFYMTGSYLELGQPDSAFAMIVQGMTVRGDDPARIALARETYRKEGFRGLARLDLEKKISIYDEQSSFPEATNNLILGNYDTALTILERAYNSRVYSVVAIKVVPLWDPVRNSPRFQAILAKLHLDK